VIDHKLKRELDLVAMGELARGVGTAQAMRRGVRLLDSWRDGDHGAVLFWADRELDLWGHGHAVLHLVHCDLLNDGRRSRGGGGWSTFAAAEILSETGNGLHRLGGAAHDPVRMTLAIASLEVSSIQLRSAHGTVERRPGEDGFCLFGITPYDPITCARALDAGRQALPGEPLLL